MPGTSIAIIGGCGHVGLPLGIAFAQAGVHVTLVDTDPARVAAVTAGRMPFLERGADEALPAAIATVSLHAVTAPDEIAEPDVVMVTIGTPSEEYMAPDVSTFDRAID